MHFPASRYWSSLVGTEVGHSITSLGKSSYGKKGDTNWQQVALCEGWANYREEVLTKHYLGLSNYVATSNAFLQDYLNMFTELTAIGCSFEAIEKSLNTKSISEFQSNLIAIYPNMDKQIKKIILNRL